MAVVRGRHALSSGDLSSYGGDAQIVATRGEIDRVIAELNGLEAWLRGQVELQDFAVDPLRRVRLAIELPPILEKLGRIRDACGHAADSYFGAETEISRELREGPELPIAQLASGIASVGSLLGVLGETKVAANLVGVESSIASPTSIGTLADRLTSLGAMVSKEKGADSAWLRIEKFREPAAPVSAANGSVAVPEARYVVYIPGTQSWGPKPGVNPFDLTSNLSAISKTGFAGSERAVEAAMKQAGIGPNSKVLLVGHSQGGLIAANISTRYAGSKVVTFGAPLGLLAGELSAPTLAVEHRADPVPQLDGRPNPLGDKWVTVRQDFAASNPLEQHEMAGYRQTAFDIDIDAGQVAVGSQATGSENSGLDRMRKELSGFAGKSAGQAYYFELARVP
jgi:pimeloyl-ACP methyl ester carboxylesterase